MAGYCYIGIAIILCILLVNLVLGLGSVYP